MHKNIALSMQVLSIQDKQGQGKYSERDHCDTRVIKMGSDWRVGKAVSVCGDSGPSEFHRNTFFVFGVFFFFSFFQTDCSI